MRDPSQSHALKNAEALSKSHHNLLPYAQEYKENEMSIRFLHSVHLVLIVIHNKNRYNLAYLINVINCGTYIITLICWYFKRNKKIPPRLTRKRQVVQILHYCYKWNLPFDYRKRAWYNTVIGWLADKLQITYDSISWLHLLWYHMILTLSTKILKIYKNFFGQVNSIKNSSRQWSAPR